MSTNRRRRWRRRRKKLKLNFVIIEYKSFDWLRSLGSTANGNELFHWIGTHVIVSVDAVPSKQTRKRVKRGTEKETNEQKETATNERASERNDRTAFYPLLCTRAHSKFSIDAIAWAIDDRRNKEKKNTRKKEKYSLSCWFEMRNARPIIDFSFRFSGDGWRRWICNGDKRRCDCVLTATTAKKTRIPIGNFSWKFSCVCCCSGGLRFTFLFDFVFSPINASMEWIKTYMKSIV